MKDRISVIIPVYNVEKYLADCIESVITQSYKNLEIIVIDDGSTDDSGAICDTYAQKDERIIVIHQKNSGAAAAKNAGLRIATGEYLTFVDSDDYLEPDAYLYMISMIQQHNADIVQCAYKDIYIDEEKEQIKPQNFCEYEVEDYLIRYVRDWTCALLWNKLYRRQLYADIYFEEGHIVDDEFFAYKGVMNARKIIYCPRIVYNYRKRKSSVTAVAQYRERVIMDKLDYLVKRRREVTTRFPQLKNDFDRQFLGMLMWLAHDAYLTKESILLIKKLMREYMREKQKCDLDFKEIVELLIIMFSRTTKLLKNRDKKREIDNINQYFD